MTRFQDKAALVTGAASGIGRATALRLAEEGARIFCADVDEAGLAETVADIEKAGGKALAGTCDVRNAEACRATVTDAITGLGRLDVLCNIAGVGSYGHATEVTTEQWDRILGVNLSGTFFMCQAALPMLLETRGNIVNMASSAGLAGIAYASAYCASKGGVVLLTKSLAVEYASRGIRVNCVCPGGVDTPLVRGFNLPDDADIKLFVRTQLVQRLGTPEEIAAAVAYLASDEAGYVNGVALSIDGGQVA